MIYCRIHLGLGDLIACAAIINKLAHDNKGQKIIVPCYAHNHETALSIFQNENIEIQVVKSDVDFPLNGYSLGYYGMGDALPNEDFVQWFYRQAGMTYEEKKKWCPIKKASEKVEQVYIDTDYAFIHDDENRGFNINYRGSFHCLWPHKDGSILRYVYAIENANEVHCIDSAFYHLVECLKPKGKLVYHKYARPDSTNFNSIHKWRILS